MRYGNDVVETVIVKKLENEMFMLVWFELVLVREL